MKRFDPDVALDRAVEAFWTTGFAATSAQDLVDAMGVNRGSLYATYGSKGELYQLALRRYRSRNTTALRAALGEPGRLVDRLRVVLEDSAAHLVDDPTQRGCLLVKAAATLRPGEPAAEEVRAALQDLRQVLAEAIHAAQTRGELPADRDPEALAAFLVTALQGLRLVGAATRDRALLSHTIDLTLSVLDPRNHERQGR